MQLLSWQQRLSALAGQQHQLVAALLAALRIHQAAAAGGGVVRQQGGAWPADGQGAALPEVRRQLLTILCAYVDQQLASLQQDAAEADDAAAGVAHVAGAAIACCLLARCPDALWAEVFPRFQRQQQQEGGRGAEAAFLQQLLPFILSDQLPSVAPEVRGAPAGVRRAEGRGQAPRALLLLLPRSRLPPAPTAPYHPRPHTCRSCKRWWSSV